MDRKLLGSQGETAAVRFFKKNGYQILSRNFACPMGEIDLICHGQGAIVFVEVKTLADDLASDPEEKVNRAKRQKLKKTADFWLQKHRHPQCAYRFDVISVILDEKDEPKIRHIPDAFLPGE
jgi:putative endonuclease